VDAQRAAAEESLGVFGHFAEGSIAVGACATKTAMAEPTVACLDLEGVLVPEIWINVAERTGIAALRRTTRDEPDYDELMRGRLAILDEHGLGLPDIEAVIGGMAPLDGALGFLDWLRSRTQVIILSDTFAQFAKPLMQKLGWPTLFCNALDVDAAGRISGYRLRQPNGKKRAVEALRAIAFRTVAAGDSYNDTTMLATADAGILFRPPANVVADFPQFPVTTTYDELRAAFVRASAGAIAP
jgi:phosphoserine/homoserine phosphotransferase